MKSSDNFRVHQASIPRMLCTGGFVYTAATAVNNDSFLSQNELKIIEKKIRISMTFGTFLLSLLVVKDVMGYNVFPTPQNSNLDMSKFPAIDRLAPIDQSFMRLYDFSQVNRSIAVNTPLANTGPANCSASDPKFGQEGSCTWSCGTCFRPDQDIVTCPSNLQWGLSFDDGLSLLRI